jgi:hypothetical protein
MSNKYAWALLARYRRRAQQRAALTLGALNMLSYFILTADIRSVSQGNIPWAIVVNLSVALLGFSLFKKLQQATSMLDRVFFAVGGTIGTVVGILVTKAVFGQ